MQLTITSVKEYPEKYSGWLNELEFLGLAVKKANDINDITEVSSLTDSLKQVMFEDYKTCYNEETEEGILVGCSYTKYTYTYTTTAELSMCHRCRTFLDGDPITHIKLKHKGPVLNELAKILE